MRIGIAGIAAHQLVRISERLVGVACFAHQLNGNTAERRRNLACRRHRVWIDGLFMMAESVGGLAPAQPHHPIAGMNCEILIEQIDGRAEVIALQKFELILERALDQRAIDAELATNFEDHIGAAEPGRAFEQPAYITRSGTLLRSIALNCEAADLDNRFPYHQCLAIAAEVVE